MENENELFQLLSEHRVIEKESLIKKKEHSNRKQDKVSVVEMENGNYCRTHTLESDVLNRLNSV